MLLPTRPFRETIPATLVLLLTFVSACATSHLPQQAIEHNAAGVAALSDEHLDDAEARFRLALEYQPAFVESRANLGLVAFRRGHLEDAEGHLRMALNQDPDFDEAWSNLGLVLLAQDRESEAIRAFESALAIDPGLVNARKNLAETLLGQGDFIGARAQLMRLVQIVQDDSPEGGSAGAQLAYCELRLGRVQAALFRAETVIAVQPGAPLAHLVRGIARAQSGELELALADFIIAESDVSLRRDVYLRRAAVYVVQARLDEAESILVPLSQEGNEREQEAVALLISEIQERRTSE